MAVFQQFVKPYRQPLVRCTVPAGRTVVHPAVVYIDAGDNAVGNLFSRRTGLCAKSANDLSRCVRT